MKVLVTLSEAELEEAAMGGVRRRISALAKQRKSTHPETPDHEQRWWESHCVGAIGEFAVAKALLRRLQTRLPRVACRRCRPSPHHV